MKPIFDILTEIADRHLNIPTLQERRSDSLDFHDVSVWGVKDALWYAYQAGVNASAGKPRLIQKQLTSSGLVHTPGLFRALQNDYRIKGETRCRAIKIFSDGYGLSREEAEGLLGGAIESEIDDEAGTITFTTPFEEPPTGSDPGGKPYSVLLLYPDDQNDSGTETYYEFVTASDPIEAVAQAQRQAAAAQDGVEIDPEDFAPLLVTQGHHYSEPLFNK